MKYQVHQVHIITEAEDDLFEIYQYVAKNDSILRAEKLLDKLELRTNRELASLQAIRLLLAGLRSQYKPAGDRSGFK